MVVIMQNTQEIKIYGCMLAAKRDTRHNQKFVKFVKIFFRQNFLSYGTWLVGLGGMAVL